MPGGKCVFNDDWLGDAQYKDWLLSVAESRHKASCSACNRIFDVSNMGETALKYHMRGTKHQKFLKINEKKIDLKKYFSAEDHAESSSSQPSTSNSCPSEVPISTNLLDRSVNANNLSRKAEILWTLKVLNSHYSYKSCENVNYIFKTMFPDSEVAKNFSCGEKKTAYLSVFGIAPYFLSLLKDKVKNETKMYVLLFDESLNEVNQTKQLDCHIRFWDHNKITTRYYSSDFLGHATSELLFEKINEKCLTLGAKNLLQLSMDGPNVNLKVLDMMMEEMKNNFNASLLNVGTCGLHVIHNAFRAGCSAAFPEVEEAASAVYWLFKDSPARREDFASVNPDVKFPLKFCKHRWVENENVLVRLIRNFAGYQKLYKRNLKKSPSSAKQQIIWNITRHDQR
ncbi:hypothetical protein AVEN_56254-1 [Araneus ventricosus]|uniref:BED-type domain-containing protein n=1 Tax=Araneus ventricosus TaxID=182803 RepID=A0A4Y2M7W1_ARAVE|nr:hypothetical protein AVEN_56254-1 [Araneus ventricosus]